MFFHETRVTKQRLCGRSVCRGCARVAPPETAVRTTAPVAQSPLPYPPFPVISHHFPAKNLPLSQCLLSIHTGNTAFKVFIRDTRHETRTLPPPGPPRPPRGHGLPARHWMRSDCFLVAPSRLHCRLFPNMACSLLSPIYPALLGYPPPPTRSRVPSPSTVLGGPHEESLSLEIPQKCTESRFPQENA